MKHWTSSKTFTHALLPGLLSALTMFYCLDQPLNAQESYKIGKIVLDAGHGGKDPGCHGHHTHEKDIALAITLELGQKIKKAFPDIDVIYTREKDVFIALNERAAIANRNKADLFISIHCNYISGRNRATGSETYVLGLHRAEDNLDVAKRENAAILLEDDFEKTYDGFDPYSVEGHIILSMFQNAHLQQSILLANNIESSFKKLSHIPSRGVKQAGFLVLRETTMPSVLVETGFLSTDADENYLMKSENQGKVADAIFKAICNYKNDVEKEKTWIAENQKPEEKGQKTSLPQVKVIPEEKDHKNSGPNPNNTSPGTASSGKTIASTSETVYRVQVAASANSSIDTRYHGLPDLEVLREDGLYKFVVGKFSTREEALKCLTALKEKGFQGAFITTYKNGQRIKA